MKVKQFLRNLERYGVEVDPTRGKGSHIWLGYMGRSTTIPFHLNKEMGSYYLKKICKQLGINPNEIL
jgi:antitoxin HicB